MSDKLSKNDIAKILINLLKYLLNLDYDSNFIITYIEKYNININTYLPSLNNDSELPIIYHCCARSDLIGLFKYLVYKGVILKHNNLIDLLIYADISYIPILSNMKCEINREIFFNGNDSIAYKLLTRGNIKKILLLHKYKVIDNNDLKYILNIPNIIFDILNSLYEKIFNICKTSDLIIDKIIEINKIYVDVFKFYFNNGISINSKHTENEIYFFQNVLNTYNYGLIEFFIQNYEIDYNKVTFIHYSNFVLENKIIMSPFYNNSNYNSIKDLLIKHKKFAPKKIRILYKK